MLPSDHFVRFYNEVFKFLEQRNELKAFYDEISRHQEFHCHKLLVEKGLQGLHEYYLKIRKEENCDMDLTLSDHEYSFFMRKCPSLSKAMNNDAGACGLYCMHCPGWLLPVFSNAGLYCVYNTMEMNRPQCRAWIFDDLETARRRYGEIAMEYSDMHLLKNFDINES